ncbi:MAG: Gfo/Idh/MocA family protein, partial [bacterium]
MPKQSHAVPNSEIASLRSARSDIENRILVQSRINLNNLGEHSLVLNLRKQMSIQKDSSSSGNLSKTMVQTEKNIAVVGAGYWGKNLLRNFYELGALNCICDNNKNRLAQTSAKYLGCKIETNFEEILKDDEIKAVVIATPAEYHFQMALATLQADKDVYVEKPLAVQVKEAEVLNEVAIQKNKILMVGHLLNYHPGIVKLKNLIASNYLGRVRYIYSHRLNLGKVRREENILWSFAPHDISVILNLLGQEPEIVSAMGGTYLQPNIQDVTLTTLKFASGIMAYIH